MARKRKNPAAVALGRLGGRASSAAKARAARENGKLVRKAAQGWRDRTEEGSMTPKRVRRSAPSTGTAD